MNKDWTGNSKTTFVQLGASSHSNHDREANDYYATDPNSLVLFLNKIKKDGLILDKNIWECACGEGHLSNVLKGEGFNVLSTDLVDRSYGDGIVDFLKYDGIYNGDILTNPPYKYAKEFVEKAISLIPIGNHVIMFLKIQFLESKNRYELFKKYPPKYVYVHSDRQTCYINGDMSEKKSSASCYCWFVWEKGFSGDPIIRWINSDDFIKF